MERQRTGGSSRSSCTSILNGRSCDQQNDRETSNKVLPFSIEAILNSPHPRRETPVLRKRAGSSPIENRVKRASPLSNLEDFTSHNLPENVEDATVNAEIGELKNTAVFQSFPVTKPGRS